MARRTVEEQLAKLQAAIANDPGAAEARAALAGALSAKQNLLVAAAADAIANAELEGFTSALTEAYERFLDNPAKKDPFCRAKTAVVRALYRTAAPATPLFLRGIRYAQHEPVWGGSQDTAVELRGLCALGLVQSGYPDAMLELADLLADPEPMARVAAAQAIAYSERSCAGVPLLRFKALTGDADLRVVSACFAGLLALAPERSLPFVAEFARGSEAEVREAAVLALGEARRPEALPLLEALAERAVDDEEARVALLAIALLRSDAAWAHLLSLVREGGEARARGAIDALATYREDAALRARVLEAVRARGDATHAAYARAAFG